MEVEGETEFLNKLLGSFASADQQKHGEALRSVETNHMILCRAIRRVTWVCGAALLLLWGNSFLAGLVPPQIYLFGERIAGVLLIGAGISYVVFTLYRALAAAAIGILSAVLPFDCGGGFGVAGRYGVAVAAIRQWRAALCAVPAGVIGDGVGWKRAGSEVAHGRIVGA